MELAEMLAIKPVDYLNNGFFDEDGEIREGINGYYSLAMAYRCREEKYSPDSLKEVNDEIDRLTEKQPASINDEPDQAIDTEALKELDKIFKRKAALDSKTLTGIYAAARPTIKTWRDYAGLAMHLDRILSQLALLVNLPKE